MRPHPFDPVSLVLGLLFVAASVVFGFTDLRLGTIDDRWIGPAVVMAIGLVLLVSAGKQIVRRPAAPAATADAAASPIDARPEPTLLGDPALGEDQPPPSGEPADDR